MTSLSFQKTAPLIDLFPVFSGSGNPRPLVFDLAPSHLSFFRRLKHSLPPSSVEVFYLRLFFSLLSLQVLFFVYFAPEIQSSLSLFAMTLRGFALAFSFFCPRFVVKHIRLLPPRVFHTPTSSSCGAIVDVFQGQGFSSSPSRERAAPHDYDPLFSTFTLFFFSLFSFSNPGWHLLLQNG